MKRAPFSVLNAILLTILTACLSGKSWADEAELKKIIALQQSLIAKMQIQINNDHSALEKLMNDTSIVRKNAEGKVIADYASSAGSATTAVSATTAGSATKADSATRADSAAKANKADSATTADSAGNANFCSYLRSDGSSNIISATWSGSNLYFNVDASRKIAVASPVN